MDSGWHGMNQQTNLSVERWPQPDDPCFRSDMSPDLSLAGRGHVWLLSRVTVAEHVIVWAGPGQ